MMTLKRFHNNGTKKVFNDDTKKVAQSGYLKGCKIYSLHLPSFKVSK